MKERRVLVICLQLESDALGANSFLQRSRGQLQCSSVRQERGEKQSPREKLSQTSISFILVAD